MEFVHDTVEQVRVLRIAQATVDSQVNTPPPPLTHDSSSLCFNPAAFAAWQDSLKTSIRTERAKWTLAIESRNAYILSLQQENNDLNHDLDTAILEATKASRRNKLRDLAFLGVGLAVGHFASR